MAAVALADELAELITQVEARVSSSDSSVRCCFMRRDVLAARKGIADADTRLMEEARAALRVWLP